MRPGRLRRPAVRPLPGSRRSTIEARYGHPRTPRDGFASAGDNGTLYSALAAAGWPDLSIDLLAPCWRVLIASGMRIQTGTATVRVEAACVDEVPPLLARPGDSWYRRPGDDQPPVLCAVSGALSENDTSAEAEVVALLEQGSAPARGEHVRLGSAVVFRKPRGLSFSASAQLMLPALTACAALQAARLPPPGSAAAAGSPPKVVVAGSTGRLPGLLTQMLRGAGCAPLVAGRAQDADAVRLGYRVRVRV